MAAHNEWRVIKGWLGRLSGRHMAAAALVTLLAGACLTLTSRPEPAPDRGLIFSHAFHADQGPLDCTICHEPAMDAPFDYSMPDHNLCGVCHDIPADALDLTPETDVSGCAMCHTREDYSVDPQFRGFPDEVLWAHEQHIAAEVDCSTCHVDPDRPARRPVPELTLKQWCMDCHGSTRPELNECQTCHSVINEDVVPTTRGGRPLPHDAPEIWERVHGREWHANPAFCSMCHTSEQQCDACHQTQAPSSHTASFRRKTHGLRATWDRQSCAVCHEEDSCIKCHNSATPTSHRAGWSTPVNRHCITCHYPPERTSCTVCHEQIEHRRAMPSPHKLGLFPPNCALCHPGGLPHRAPHPMNSTMRCTQCHR